MTGAGKGINKEDHHASSSNRHRPPPPSIKLKPPVNLSQLWLALPAEEREQTLNALSRVVPEHPPMAPVQPERAVAGSAGRRARTNSKRAQPRRRRTPHDGSGSSGGDA